MTFFDDERVYFNVLENVIFNFIDVYMEIQQGNTALVSGDYVDFGRQVGKIVSDIFLKNPSSSDWSRHNSEIAQAVMKKSPQLTDDGFNLKKTSPHKLFDSHRDEHL